jgi:ABC-type nitrate/sulfonate/bicarbonate transport system substrate-binding protein
MKYWRSIAIALVILVLVIVTGSRRSGEDSPGSADPVRIGWAPVVGSLPLFVAFEHDLFAKHGITVDRVEFSSSNDLLNALVAGQIDLIPAISLVPVVHLEIQYPGTVRVFAYSRATPGHASDSIIARSDGPIASLDDLAGRRIGVFPGTTATRILRAFLERRGVPVDGITFVPLSSATQVTAIESGSVDALFAYEPTTTVAQESGRFRLVHGSVYASLLDPSPLGGAAISRAFERDHPDRARSVIAALDDAILEMRADLESARTLIPSFTGIEPEIARQTTIVPSGLSTENDLAVLDRMVALLHEVGEIPATLDAERLVAH